VPFYGTPIRGGSSIGSRVVLVLGDDMALETKDAALRIAD
jgi:hypothetical protein